MMLPIGSEKGVTEAMESGAELRVRRWLDHLLTEIWVNRSNSNGLRGLSE